MLCVTQPLSQRISALISLTRLEVHGFGHSDTGPAMTTVINELTGLRDLKLVSTNLGQLPVSILGLSALSVLRLEGNNITFIPVVQFGLTGLRSLTIARNSIPALSNVVTRLRALTELVLDRLDISSLPVEFGDFESLERLTIRHYTGLRTQRVPLSLANMSTLRYLNMCGTEIQTDGRPGSIQWLISHLSGLDELDLTETAVGQVRSRALFRGSAMM